VACNQNTSFVPRNISSRESSVHFIIVIHQMYGPQGVNMKPFLPKRQLHFPMEHLISGKEVRKKNYGVVNRLSNIEPMLACLLACLHGLRLLAPLESELTSENMNPFSHVGRTSWKEDGLIVILSTWTTEHRKTQIHIFASSIIRTHDSSVGKVQDHRHPRWRSRWDRLRLTTLPNPSTESLLCTAIIGLKEMPLSALRTIELCFAFQYI